MCAVSDLKVLLTRQQIAQRVKELGAEITRDFAGESVVFVGVLKGAAIFLSDLARAVELDSTFDFIGVSSYGNRPEPAHELQHGWDSTGEVKLTKDVDQSMEGKNIILVEDILDTGLTLTFLKKFLTRAQAEGAQDRRLARQTFAEKAANRGGLRRLQDSRRVRSGIRAGLCGTLSESGGCLHCSARVEGTGVRFPWVAQPTHRVLPTQTEALLPAAIIDVVDSLSTQPDLQLKIDPLLLEVADVVNTTLDLDTTLRRVAELVRKVIDYEIFAILLLNEHAQELRFRFQIGYPRELPTGPG